MENLASFIEGLMVFPALVKFLELTKTGKS